MTCVCFQAARDVMRWTAPMLVSLGVVGCFQGNYLDQTCPQGQCSLPTSASGTVSSGNGSSSESESESGKASESSDGTASTSGTATSDDPDMPEVLKPRAFRLTTMSLIDPHVFADNPPPCGDITELLNEAVLPQQLANDDESVVLVFPEFDSQSSDLTGQLLYVYPAVCNGAPPNLCRPNGVPTIVIAHTQSEGNCQDVDISTFNQGNLNGFNNPNAPCFRSEPGLFSMSLLGQDPSAILHDGTLAARFDTSDEPQSLVKGYLAGYLLEETARALIFDVFGNQFSLWSMIQGGEACVHPSMPPSDVDAHTVQGMPGNGVWAYFNLEARLVEWNPNPI